MKYECHSWILNNHPQMPSPPNWNILSWKETNKMQKTNSLTSRKRRSETSRFYKAPPHDERSKKQLTGDTTLNCPSSWRRYSWIYRLPCQSCIELLDCSFLELTPIQGGLFNDTVPLSPCTYMSPISNTALINSNELIALPCWPLQYHFSELFLVSPQEWNVCSNLSRKNEQNSLHTHS